MVLKRLVMTCHDKQTHGMVLIQTVIQYHDMRTYNMVLKRPVTTYHGKQTCNTVLKQPTISCNDKWISPQSNLSSNATQSGLVLKKSVILSHDQQPYTA